MGSISKFVSTIKGGLQRQHKFKVSIDFPTFAGGTDVIDFAEQLARTAALPNSTVGVIDVPYSGRVVPVPGDRAHDEFSITFLGINDTRVRDAFEIWSEYINGSESNTAGSADLTDFWRDVVMEQLDQMDNVVKTYILRDAWPTVVSVIELDQSQRDTFDEYTVTFRFTSVDTVGITR